MNKLHIKELHNLYSCSGIIGGTGEMHTGFWWANVRERTHLEDVGVDERSDGYSRHRMGGRALVLSGSGEGKVAGSCDHGDEPSGSIE